MKPSVIVQISEGLGNQMFQYAAGRALALRNDVPLYLDIYSQYRINHFNREYLLDNFKIDGIIVNKVLSFVGNIGSVFQELNKGKYQRVGQMYFERSKSVDMNLIKTKINKPFYLFGFWQNEEYFEDFKDSIKNDFQRKTPVSSDSLTLSQEMNKRQSVCVHLRTYYEITNTNFKKKIKYYEDAIARMKDEVPDAYFYIFTDNPNIGDYDINMNVPHSFVHINTNRGYLGAIDDLWLMNQCKHHILSSSSFSWWGAYLADSKNGKVFVQNGCLMDTDSSFPSRWERL